MGQTWPSRHSAQAVAPLALEKLPAGQGARAPPLQKEPGGATQGEGEGEADGVREGEGEALGEREALLLAGTVIIARMLW